MSYRDEITFRFICDLRCYLANGDITTLRNIVVNITEPDTEWALQSAHDAIESIATQIVHDGGSRLLDAPLDHIELTRCRLDSTSLDDNEPEYEYQDRD
jgi:hypothetical protein